MVTDYARCLSRRGHEITLAWPQYDSRPLTRSLRDWAKSLLTGAPRDAPPEIDRTHISQDMHGCRLVETSGPVVRESDVPDADVVVATWWTATEAMQSFSSRKGRKVHFVQGDDTVVAGHEERASRAWRAPMDRILVAPWLEARVRELAPAAKVEVVLNGVDTVKFNASARKKQARPRVGYVYSDALIKGCDVIARALDQVRRATPELDVVTFGQEPPRREMPLADQAVFHLRPAQSQIVALYGSCDVWVWGSRMEGFGLPMLEAMACRTPVVATDAGAASALVARGRGRLVKVEAHDELASAVIEYCQMPVDQWEGESAAARALAETRTVEHAAGEFLRALEGFVALG